MMPAAVVERQAELRRTSGFGRTPAVQTSVAVGDALAVGELDTPSRRRAVTTVFSRRSKPRRVELPGRVLAEPPAKVVQDVVGGVGQEPSSAGTSRRVG